MSLLIRETANYFLLPSLGINGCSSYIGTQNLQNEKNKVSIMGTKELADTCYVTTKSNLWTRKNKLLIHTK